MDPIPTRSSSPALDRFRRIYTASACVPGGIIAISLAAALFSGNLRLLNPALTLPFAVIPFVPMILKGGIRKNQTPAVWIARGYAVILVIVQISMFVDFTKAHGEGPNGEGSPLAVIISMVFFAAVFLCPWALTALRSFFQRNP